MLPHYILDDICVVFMLYFLSFLWGGRLCVGLSLPDVTRISVDVTSALIDGVLPVPFSKPFPSPNKSISSRKNTTTGQHLVIFKPYLLRVTEWHAPCTRLHLPMRGKQLLHRRISHTPRPEEFLSQECLHFLPPAGSLLKRHQEDTLTITSLCCSSMCCLC